MSGSVNWAKKNSSLKPNCRRRKCRSSPMSWRRTSGSSKKFTSWTTRPSKRTLPVRRSLQTCEQSEMTCWKPSWRNWQAQNALTIFTCRRTSSCFSKLIARLQHELSNVWPNVKLVFIVCLTSDDVCLPGNSRGSSTNTISRRQNSTPCLATLQSSKLRLTCWAKIKSLRRNHRS